MLLLLLVLLCGGAIGSGMTSIKLPVHSLLDISSNVPRTCAEGIFQGLNDCTRAGRILVSQLQKSKLMALVLSTKNLTPEGRHTTFIPIYLL